MNKTPSKSPPQQPYYVDAKIENSVDAKESQNNYVYDYYSDIGEISNQKQYYKPKSQGK